ncbi:MAG: polysaccharide biosynthesis tyrosine autokinase [Microcoleaceae cyanobacterium]
MVRNLATQIRELEARNQILDETVVELNQEVKQLSVVSREYSDIQRELGITTKNLEQFLSRREAFKIDIAQQETPWQLITPTGTPKPAAASAKKNLVLGSVLGLLLGTGAALLFDKLSNNLYTPKDLKELTRLPLLGIIPWNKNLESAALDHRPALENLYQESRETTFDSILSSSSPLSKSKLSPAFYEAFRSLYTNIRLLSPDAAIRSLTVTSAMPLEGKTTIATYLAQAAADQGRRVLLVDADLRSPSIHQQMGLTNGMGLTDVVLADTDFNHVIQQSSSNTHLFILTAGLAPPDPVRILSSQKMAEVMDKLQETFDLVIYDSAPLSGLADTYLLAAETNGVVLTAGLGTVKRSILENVMGDLQQHPNFRVPLLGVVANRAQNVSQNLYDYNYYTQESPWRPSPGNDDSHDTPSNGQVAAEVGQKKPNKSLLGRFRKS